LVATAEVSVDIANVDTYGNDPLPEYIGAATVSFLSPDRGVQMVDK